jgi:hypothetical protein
MTNGDHRPRLDILADVGSWEPEDWASAYETWHRVALRMPEEYRSVDRVANPMRRLAEELTR